MTQLINARAGRVTPEMEAVAAIEKVSVEEIMQGVAEGTIVIPKTSGVKRSG